MCFKSSLSKLPVPLSPHVLLQESLWGTHDYEFWILVSCMLLNQTSRKQVEKIFRRLRERYPTPKAFEQADEKELAALIKPLGFYNRRAKTLIKFAQAYVLGAWCDAHDLPGCGEYAQTAWEMFCRQKIPNTAVKDGALETYRKWYFLHFD